MLKFFYLYVLIITIFSSIFFLFVNDLTIKLISFVYTLLIFIISVYSLTKIDFSTIFFYCYQFNIFNFSFIIGIDSLSILFVLLVSFLFPLIILASWFSIKFKIKLFYFILICMEFCLLNFFISFDLFFFYFWFESILIPMFFIIIFWGNQNRKLNAALYLVSYTLLFTIFFFLCILYFKVIFNTSNIFTLSYFFSLNKNYQIYFWFLFFLAFAVKLPIFPFHLWLPEAHVEAPTAGSIILASLLLKMGYYGYMRFFLQMFPFSSFYFNSLIVILCVLGSIYGAFLALSQVDIKKIIAYSSVSHMSLCLLGASSNNIFGLLGSFLLAVGHGFVSTALFFLIGFLYERYHNRTLDYFSGLNLILPIYSFFLFSFLISNFGFPISINFVAELFILIGIGSWNFLLLLILIFYSVLSVSYNLWLYVRLCHGSLNLNLIKIKYFYDLSKIELFVLVPLFFCNSLLCFFPTSFLKLIIPFFLVIL